MIFNNLKKKNDLFWLAALSILCFGGFYDWGAAFLGAAVSVVGIFRILRKKSFCYTKEKWFFLFLIFAASLAGGILWGIDQGMSLIGVLRFVPVLLWVFLCMQYSKEERQDALSVIPLMGCFTVVTGGIAYIIPSLQPWFWSADRLGGFFQYSNTCAIFFLLGMMMSEGKKEKTAKLQWSCLLFGILLTGSRTVMVMTLLLLFLSLVQKKTERAWRQYIVWNLAAAFIAGCMAVWITGSYQNFARLATVFTSNSTFYGRLLYWQDAMGILFKYPLGLGYKGYFYLQPVMQTGVYTTMYVHNEFLQSFLDGGLAGGISFLGLMLLQLRKSKNKRFLLVLLLHSMVDFNFQYIAIWFLAVLLFEFETTKLSFKKEHTKIFLSGGSMTTVLCLYFCLPFWFYFQQDYGKAVTYYPMYTEAKEALLAYTGEPSQAEALADNILRNNPYPAIAHDAKALVAYNRGDIYSFATHKEKVLQIARYDITQYRDYDALLRQYEEQALAEGNREEAEFCRERMGEIEKMLKKTEENTSALAYKIRDLPVFSLN